MICVCGTMINVEKNSSKIICNRCSRETKSNTVNITSIYKEIEKEIQVDIQEVKGAKIKYQCPNCNADEMMYNTAQLRSADEGQTVFYSCECGYKLTVQS